MLRRLRTVGLASALAVVLAVPASAGPVEDCYDAVINRCDAALDGAKWYEKVAVGAACTLMLAGCAGAAF